MKQIDDLCLTKPTIYSTSDEWASWLRELENLPDSLKREAAVVQLIEEAKFQVRAVQSV